MSSATFRHEFPSSPNLPEITRHPKTSLKPGKHRWRTITHAPQLRRAGGHLAVIVVGTQNSGSGSRACRPGPLANQMLFICDHPVGGPCMQAPPCCRGPRLCSPSPKTVCKRAALPQAQHPQLRLCIDVVIEAAALHWQRENRPVTYTDTQARSRPLDT